MKIKERRTKFVVLLKGQEDQDAWDRMHKGHETYEDALESARHFDSMIPHAELREAWLPQRIVRVSESIDVTIEEVHGETGD